ncbi:hypothetical protein [Blastococcus sp. KM273129]|uniref:hypothetical protein n=1 Tax=Blastococcus sp. KM273129 TaxID=2570315 RepID=UPI001F4214C6|nr:hypothetical protein [Blastococcus sp. KM273129]MCF6736120.1 hypothetical protein [Blastococcus sp. KM273129]
MTGPVIYTLALLVLTTGVVVHARAATAVVHALVVGGAHALVVSVFVLVLGEQRGRRRPVVSSCS